MLSFEKNILLAPFTTFKIGGPAKFFCKAKSIDDIKEAISWAQEKKLPFLILGGGSNLLISDKGFPGLAIKNEVHGLRLQGEALEAQSGSKLQDLVDFTIQNGLSGMQKMAGIYGTIGGAVFGNAGAYGQTISDHLIKVTALDYQAGQILEFTKEQCEFGYRDSVFKRNKYIILEIQFKLLASQTPTLSEETQEIIGKRTAKFPPVLKCPGSFFKNISVEKIPESTLKLIPQEKVTFGKVPAAVLLDLVGAKGQKVGNIQVSESHANLIINKGEGKAQDVWQLAQELTKAVKEKFDIILEPEVQFINLPKL